MNELSEALTGGSVTAATIILALLLLMRGLIDVLRAVVTRKGGDGHGENGRDARDAERRSDRTDRDVSDNARSSERRDDTIDRSIFEASNEAVRRDERLHKRLDEMSKRIDSLPCLQPRGVRQKQDDDNAANCPMG